MNGVIEETLIEHDFCVTKNHQDKCTFLKIQSVSVENIVFVINNCTKQIRNKR